jgi:putative transposase
VKANTARKYRLYPDRGQAERLTEWSHTCRAVWNTALAQRIWAYRSARRVTLRGVDQCAELTEARAEHDWLRDLPAQSAQQVLRHLDDAYANFWNPQHPAEFPQFKRKHRGCGVPFPGQAVQVRKVSRRIAQVRLPKLGWVRLRLSRPLGGTVRNAMVSRDGLGWHISFGVHIPEPDGRPVNTGEPVGVDVGIACSVFLSTEDTQRQRPDTLTPGEKRRLRGLEQRKARQMAYAKKHNGGKYSHRLRRTIERIAALNARQARRRGDWNHKLTTDLAQNPRPGRGRELAGQIHVPLREGHRRATRSQRETEGRAQPIHRRPGMVRDPPPARVQDPPPRRRTGRGTRAGVVADL